MRTDDFDVAGVTLASAHAWATGQIYARQARDLDTARGEVAFLNEIGNRQSWRAAVAAAHDLWRHGARAAIAHVTNPVLLKKYQRGGGLVTFKETVNWRGKTLPAVRVFIPPAGWDAWNKKLRTK